MKKIPPNDHLECEWKQVYEPINSIDPNIYETTTQRITMDEIADTLLLAPQNKATGPSGISNEILKHLPTKALETLLKIFNGCMELTKIPKAWTKSYIWPISKKKIYDFNLTNTRPITLIEHTRKLFTKIINNRLTTVIRRHEILSPLNFAGFPFQSTMQPIANLTHIIEDTTTNNRELWALSQDMSKAFNSVHIETLK